MSKKNVKYYVVPRGMGNGNWIEGNSVSSIKEADVVVFTGGQDVSPSLYGESNKYTRSHLYNSGEELPARDAYELDAFNEAKALGKVLWGNCRGIQFLTAMAGGKLIQDVNHPGSHTLHMWDGELIFNSNSCHHQMCWPFNLREGVDYYVLGSTLGLSKYHVDGSGKEMSLPTNKDGIVMEPEMLYYPRVKALGFQGHVEWMDINSTMAKVARAFLHLELEDKLENIMKLGLSSKDIVNRAFDFKFTEEEEALLQNIEEPAQAAV